MARIHGVAGEWARVKGTVAGLWPLFLGVFACGFSLALFLFYPLASATLLVASVVWILWSLVRGLRHVERFFKGARGEEKVAAVLRSLPDAYHVFNDFAAGRAHVDHVVVGPGGVFSVETKSWRGVVTVEDSRVLLDGQLPDRDPLAQTLREAALVRTVLAARGWTGAVTPVLVFASNAFSARCAEVRGVTIINLGELKAGFASGRVVISPSELDRLVSLMETVP